jgi:DNA gyrase/topoisomerase IV subunit A
MRTREEDFVDQLFIASTHAYILIFTDRGRVYWRKVHEIPNVGRAGKGKPALLTARALEGLTDVAEQRPEGEPGLLERRSLPPQRQGLLLDGQLGWALAVDDSGDAVEDCAQPRRQVTAAKMDATAGHVAHMVLMEVDDSIARDA